MNPHKKNIELTIISKATADELDREALISTVLEPIFAPKRHKASA